MKPETRSITYPVFRREADTDQPAVLVSTAPPWDTLSVDLGGFRERFARGAFDLSDGVDVVSTWNHRDELLLGRTPGTLELHDTDDGLQYTLQLPDTQLGRDLAHHVDRGDVRGSSFEFTLRPNGEVWEENDDGVPIRTITSARLWQVGPVTHPAYSDGADVALRSLERWRAQPAPVTEARLAEHRRRLLEMRLRCLTR